MVTRRLKRVEPEDATLRASAAVWFAPAIILILQFSAIGLATGLVLVVSASRLLCSNLPAADLQHALPNRVKTVIATGELPVELLARHFPLALFVSAGLQMAAVSVLIDFWVLAAGLLAISTAILTAVSVRLGAWEEEPPNLPRSAMGLILTVLLALMAHWGGYGVHVRSGRALAFRSAREASSSASPTKAAAASEAGLGGNYAGVILWPEIKRVTTLVAPLASGATIDSPAAPLNIPFGGEYWLYRWPYRRPPQHSTSRRGTPAALSFRTTDQFPLNMEAHQKLERPISLRCCGRLRVVILNVDRYPESVSLEVLLIDGQAPDPASQSLGRRRVNSSPDVAAERPAPVREVLNFPIPSPSGLTEFDEIKVVFHRSAHRVDRSARIAIERFVLMPL
jgi:hypothetical protein